MSHVEKNQAIREKNQLQLRTLEQFFVENKVDNLIEMLEKKKEQLCNQMIEYANEHTEILKRDKYGNPLEEGVKVNPIVVNNYFFKSIVPIGSVEPQYNAEKLAIVYDYYNYLITEVNNQIGNFPASLTSFCKLAGITLNTLRSYRNSNDLAMRTIAEKIYDQIGDVSLSMSQLGIVKEHSTLARLKVENELVEKSQPKVVLNYTEVVDTDKINSRINKYSKLIDKKGKK